jgi:hypothetical protein
MHLYLVAPYRKIIDHVLNLPCYLIDFSIDQMKTQKRNNHPKKEHWIYLEYQLKRPNTNLLKSLLSSLSKKTTRRLGGLCWLNFQMMRYTLKRISSTNSYNNIGNLTISLQFNTWQIWDLRSSNYVYYDVYVGLDIEKLHWTFDPLKSNIADFFINCMFFFKNITSGVHVQLIKDWTVLHNTCIPIICWQLLL